MRIVPIWKYIVVAFVALLALNFLYPSIRWYSQPAEWRRNFNMQNFNALPEVAELRAQQARLREATGEVSHEDEIAQIEDDISAHIQRWQDIRSGIVRLGLDLQGGIHVLIEVRKPEGVPADEWDLTNARESTIERLGNRIDQYGLEEATLTSHGANYILMQIPGGGDIPDWESTGHLQLSLMKEPGDKGDLASTIRRISRATGLPLERRIQSLPSSPGTYQVNADDRPIVERWLMPPKAEEDNVADATESEYFRVSKYIPEGYRFLFGRREGNPDVREWYELYLVKEREELSGDLLKRSAVAFTTLNEPYVEMEFKPEGAKKFRRVTASNVGRRLAIVMDDTVYSAPVIRERIAGGRATIEGSFGLEEAKRLAIVLNAGQLVADVHTVEERSVGPELGSDSIRQGITAIQYASISVVIFMIVYYAWAGVIADLAVLLNLFLLTAALAMFKATLTLPGLAGFALTVGMAVDANVLIFERIREELRTKGITPGTAVDKGFSRAFSAIWDGNLTTLLVALLLLGYGSGPIRGFAITLALGIAISMFTALFCAHIVFDLIAKRPGATTVSVGTLRFLHDTRIDFLKYAKPAFVLSGVVIGVTWLHMAIFGLNMGVDFQGGTLARVTLPAEVTADDVRAVLDRHGMGDALIQTVRGDKNTLQIRVRQREVEVGTSEDDAFTIGDRLVEAYPGSVVESEESVGAKTGHELLVSALWLVFCSSIIIIGYVALRFQFWFGIAAVIALWHDVMITVGIFNITGREMNLPVVAALLTIIGYSVNDTIVIFDRIRENLKAGTTRFTEIVVISINETLSRTIITSLTVLMTTLALYFFGGPVLNDFAFTFVVGVIAGSYSTVFLASPIVVLHHKYRQRKEQALKQGA